MSLLRLAVPGQPTRLIDQGPSTGRTTHARYGIRGSIGGALVTPMPGYKREEAAARARRDHERYVRDKEAALERQRRYRARMRELPSYWTPAMDSTLDTQPPKETP